MSGLSTARFPDYFKALHGRSPYSWQSRLADRAAEGDWPDAIDLPTGSGKTACIDIAVFALACQAPRGVTERNAPRRVFFCVNRRVIVDEAFQRARRISERLRDAERDPAGPAENPPVLRDVAAALRRLSGTVASDGGPPPLDVLELRGGIYRDNRWARSATQPTVVCTTVDQLGSRLLFRGYGVSPGAAPVQAALIAYDSLVLLDEAHISRPFHQTLDRVRRYLDPGAWAGQAIGARPFLFVPMTATPPAPAGDRRVIRLDDKDRQNESLALRLGARKPAALRAVPDVAAAAVNEAKRLAKGEPRAIGVVVNRVATARSIYEILREELPNAEVELVIGSMRPLDRDAQAGRLRERIGPERPDQTGVTSVTVATQCLEAGADYDFDDLITECASLDALRQRFGRLNRRGRPIESRAVILAGKKDVKPHDQLSEDKPLDPIYGNALALTWNWLSARAAEVVPMETTGPQGEKPARSKTRAKAGGAGETGTLAVDFGIDAFDALLGEHNDDGQIPKDLLASSAALDAPVMLPAYPDAWCQTSPAPSPDPDVALFLHGPQGREADIQVCWRDDLIEDSSMTRDHWCDVVALLPPTSAECMSVPIARVRRWLTGRTDGSSGDGDLLGVGGESEADDTGRLERAGVIWRGINASALVTSPDDLRPGDTLVLPVGTDDEGGWQDLGHVPVSPAGLDVAEASFERARGKAVLRLHPLRRSGHPELKPLLDRACETDEPPTAAELRAMITAAASSIPEGPLRRRLEHLADRKLGLIFERYPDERGLVLTTRRRFETNTEAILPCLDDGDDDASRVGRKNPVRLDDHTDHVKNALGKTLSLLPAGEFARALTLAAERHDWGKADERFQALLSRSDRTDAWLRVGRALVLLAKSDGVPKTPGEYRAACERAGLPHGFRHEMLSVQLAERVAGLPDDAGERDLVLHLIAAHHGRGRPFAPVVPDDDAPAVEIDGIRLTADDRRRLPAPHRLDSGIPARFWSLTRRFGWWGLAYLEALLRLADQQASADEDAGRFDDPRGPEPDEDDA